ncbi:TPA: DNA helicase UvrD [archaeon]|uniref:DNA helicase UvrD n=1 Tax=Candidatus Naiadarchaeum limnaeum TaxID=2756139 RepID=A0A832UZ48_9ARCH|nr:DNA helicase UvrD [Candidatus Naiadarchaeum limnaeum]
MKLFADLHLHSRFSRACSKDLSLEKIEYWARKKGLSLLGTGDFTHPEWIKELKRELKEDEKGIYKSNNGFPFVLQAEISNIYEQDGKIRKIHNILLAPNFETVEQISDFLKDKGNLKEDGRPTFTFSCVELVEKLKEISKEIEIIPAHAWTPWFSIFGSNSGFNSVEECFLDKSNEIFALETGLSSDPQMNWRLSKLDRFTLVSNSDSHSYWPWRMGRECNILDIELSYKNLIKAIRTGEGFLGTIEVDPNYGKYHFDGHRSCNISLSPKESIAKNNKCPKCGRKLTIGVLHRVDELADRQDGFKPKGKPDFYRLIPLAEVIAGYLGLEQAHSKKVFEIYDLLIGKFKNELNILLETNESELKKAVDEKLVKLIIDNREGKIEIIPGYDGVYGVAKISGIAKKKKPQKTLGEY